MPNELTLEQFAAESKGLFGDLMQKVKDLASDRDNVRQAFEDFKANQASLKDTVDGLATKMNRPSIETPDPKAEYAKHFDGFLRKGSDIPAEFKALSTNPDTEGGFLMPENRSGEILAAAAQFAPIRNVARIITLNSGDSYKQPTTGTATVGRVGEKGTRSETAAPTIGNIEIFAHEYYANTYATQKILDDSAYSVDQLIQQEVNKAFNVLIADDYVEGTGVNMAVGFTTKVTASVLSGTAATSKIAGLVKLYTKLKPAYRKNASYAMNGNVLATLLAEASGTVQPMFQPNLTTGDGVSFLGRPIIEMSELPDDGAAAYPIYFGDFGYYWIVDRKGMTVLRDPYSAKPYVTFYTTIRTGGDLVLAEAFAKQKSNNA